ncbi:hypothetical protein H5410_017001 [Solanum commersonii]|uniref:Mitochondrial carrier protein n=1 Tax=Solanum commersonii TaxID=4109 RepID=A0A9J5ZY27_SOLCO|nr:hypothetical protein H5410_017001 [Solanum commersonii]
MVDELKQGENSWIDTAEQSDRVLNVDNNVSLMSQSIVITDGVEPLHPQQPPPQGTSPSSDVRLGFPERAISAAGAAFLSAVLVNPLDVVKTRLQAQAAGVAYSHPMSNMTSRMAVFGPNMNQSLLMKWLWRFVSQEQALWKETIKTRFGMENLWITSLPTQPYGSGVWRSIRNLWAKFFNKCKTKVGNGGRTLFWEDRWVDQCKDEDNLFWYPDKADFQLAQLIEAPVTHIGGWPRKMIWKVKIPIKMFADLRCSPSCTRAGVHGTVSICPPDCFQYKGALDVFYKIIRQEGISKLWRGTNAGLALAVPTVGIYLPCYDIFRNKLEEFTAQHAPSLTPYTPLLAGSLARSLACTSCYPIELARTRMQAFKDMNKKPAGVWKTLFEVIANVRSTTSTNFGLQSYRVLWSGLGAQLARDVPFSAICWSTLEPVRRRLLIPLGDEANAVGVLGANFSAGFVAGSIAAAATCPLDVAKTRRQIEMDPARALTMTTRQTLLEIWRDGGLKGLFTGVGPRVGRAGPSVGIVVSFYEVVKYMLHQQYASS